MPELYVPACDVREDARGSGGAAPLTLPCRPLTRPSRSLTLAGRPMVTPRRLAGLAVAVAVALTVLLGAALLATV